MSHFLTEQCPRYGHPTNCGKENEFLTMIAIDIARGLVHGGQVDEFENETIIVTLNNGLLLSLVCMPDKSVRAFATRIGATYFVAINYGLIRLMFNLSLSVWRDQRFIKHVGSVMRDVNILGIDFIPVGFEEALLDADFNMINEYKNTAFYISFEQAISFIWLHEIAHVLFGHIDICLKQSKSLSMLDEFLSLADIDSDDELNEVSQLSIPFHAFEIQADRWALDRLFDHLHKKIASDKAGDRELLSTTVGCSLFLLSLHGFNTLQNKFDLAKYHPPLWFRSDEVLYAENNSANRQWFNKLRENQRFDAIRFHQKNLVQFGLSGLSRLHPMYADWLGPIAEVSRQAEAQNVLEEANKPLQEWNEELARYQCAIESKYRESKL